MSKKSWSVHSALPYWRSFSVFYIAEKELVKIIILIPNLDLVTWYYPSCRLIVAMALIELAVDLGVGIFPTPHWWPTIYSLQSTACGKLQIFRCTFKQYCKTNIYEWSRDFMYCNPYKTGQIRLGEPLKYYTLCKPSQSVPKTRTM